MRYKPKSSASPHIAVGGLSKRMRVEVDPDINVSAKTVGELREVTAWPENLAVTVPPVREPHGGGSHGAFAWGVLDRLLEEETLSFEGISGTSAGAANAVVLADGFAAGGREGLRIKRESP